MADRNTLEGLVCQNRMEEAIDQLKTLIQDLSNEPLNSLIALSGRFSAVNQTLINGTASLDITEVESNKIRASFLAILSDVREEIQSKINFFKPIPRASEDRDVLRDFIDTVLSRKYVEITPFSEGNSFIYFHAKERHSEQDVMIMVLKTSDIEDVKKNSQLRRISQLKHRNLIQLLDVNFQTYPCYIITEFVSGVNLQTLMATTGPFPLYNAKRLLLIIGDVMNYLRQKKFVHSGIRPSKILIDKELEPEISPFDIIRVNEAKRLASSFLEDSYYFAPERLNGIKDNSNDSTDKANQFCLAALAYQMLTGERLFKGTNLTDTLLARHRFFNDSAFRKEKLSHPRLVPAMSSILKKMLQESPSKRYDDLPTALNKIARVRAVQDKNEEIVFASYRRCLAHSDNFINQFYENLFAEPGTTMTKPQTKEEHDLLYQNFHLLVHLLFDVENAVLFMKRIARLSAGKKNVLSDYLLFVDVFIKTVSHCDPRWQYNSGVKAAWTNLKDQITDSISANLPLVIKDMPEEAEPGAGVPAGKEADEGTPIDMSFTPESRETEIESEDDNEIGGDMDVTYDDEKA